MRVYEAVLAIRVYYRTLVHIVERAVRLEMEIDTSVD